MLSQFSVFLCFLLSSLMSSAYQTCSGPRYLLPLSWEGSWGSEQACRKDGSWETGPQWGLPTHFFSARHFFSVLIGIWGELTAIDGNRQKFTEINGDFRVFPDTKYVGFPFPVTFTFSADLTVSHWKTPKLTSKFKIVKVMDDHTCRSSQDQHCTRTLWDLKKN